MLGEREEQLQAQIKELNAYLDEEKTRGQAGGETEQTCSGRVEAEGDAGESDSDGAGK